MPVSIASQRDPSALPRNGSRPAPQPSPATPRLRVPQARVLAALVPPYPEDPPRLWPLWGRPALARRAGYTPVSGSITRALNGIRAGSSSGDPQTGLLALGYVETVEVDVCGVTESNYRITAAGVAALHAYLAEHGELPPLRDQGASTNKRYRK